MEPEKTSKADSNANSNVNNETIVMVYIGETEHKDKLFQQWIEVKENSGEPLPTPADVRMWQKLEKHAIVGTVYEFKGRHDENDRLVVSTPGRWVGQWKNEEDRSRWQLDDRLTRLMREARREFLPDEIIEPVRAAYQATPHFNRQAFVAWLFQAIQRKAK